MLANSMLDMFRLAAGFAAFFQPAGRSAKGKHLQVTMDSLATDEGVMRTGNEYIVDDV